jgi:hypothetical protein
MIVFIYLKPQEANKKKVGEFEGKVGGTRWTSD